MRIAVVGSGIAGLYSAWQLGMEHQVVLLEQAPRLGGHTDTHCVQTADGELQVDSGFIVFNEQHYPLFSAMLDELGVASQPSNMSFSVSNRVSGLEYNPETLNTLFCQRRNLLSLRFWRLLRDLLRFYRNGAELLAQPEHLGLARYLSEAGYSEVFRDEHLMPMAAALWSADQLGVDEFPVRFLARFMHNHQMLQLTGRPQWRCVSGGSSRYIDALQDAWRVEVRTGARVLALRQASDGWTLQVEGQEAEHFDQVVLACHSDQALALLAEPSVAQQEVLGAIRYRANDMLLHSDTSVMPRKRRAWAAWNVRLGDAESATACQVTYWMNRLQRLATSTPLLVSLNQAHSIDPDRVHARRSYQHPVFDSKAVAAQRRWGEISGQRGLHFCGAYWGWGFHEDGVASAHRVVASIRNPACAPAPCERLSHAA